MKARAMNAARLAKLDRRLTTVAQWVARYHKRTRRGKTAQHARGGTVYAIGANHHEPIHEAKQRPTQPRKPAQPPQQVPDMLPDFAILAIAAQAKRKRAVR